MRKLKLFNHRSRFFLSALLVLFLAVVAFNLNPSKPSAESNLISDVMRDLGLGVSPISSNTPTLSAPQSSDLDDTCPGPNTWAYVITQAQIDKYQNDIHPIGYAGYTIEGADIEIEENGVSAKVDLNNRRAIFTRIRLTDGGKDFKVDEISSVGENELSRVELTALKVALQNADTLLWRFLGDEYYQKAFLYVNIPQDGVLKAFFYTSEYLECIGR